jgi:hypothetical protein
MPTKLRGVTASPHWQQPHADDRRWGSVKRVRTFVPRGSAGPKEAT